MRYAHTTIIVSDIEKSIQFYEEVAGLTIRNKFSAGSKTLASVSYTHLVVAKNSKNKLISSIMEKISMMKL